MEELELDDDTPKLRPTRPHKSFPVKADPSVLSKFVSEPKVLKFAPIMYIDYYLRDAKLSAAEEQRYRELYTPPPEPEVVPVVSLDVPSDPLTVFTTIRVLKSGLVRVKITVPMEPVYLHELKGKVAPIDVRIKAAKGFGYPESVLTKMLDFHDARKSRIEKLDEFVESIFGKYTSAKSNKPKKKTNQETLNSKLKKKPLKKYS